MPEDDWAGLLFVGDPHLSTRAPGFRKDEYAETVLGKLRWCINYARDQRLMPVLLGDLFHHPRDISNRLLVELLSLFREPVLAVAGNHDCSENSLCDHDSLAVLVAAGCVKLLDRDGPCRIRVGDGSVVIGGTAWGQYLPKTFDAPSYQVDGGAHVFWVTHHDIRFPGYDDSGHFDCKEIPGIDVIINGHIHRSLPEVRAGKTTWINPGNICRVSRSEATKLHKPTALRFNISRDGWESSRVEVPHQPFDDVFHEFVESERIELGDSLFVSGLMQLESARTASGAGLQSFLDANLAQFPEEIATEIRSLANEVLNDAN